MREFNY